MKICLPGQSEGFSGCWVAWPGESLRGKRTLHPSNLGNPPPLEKVPRNLKANRHCLSSGFHHRKTYLGEKEERLKRRSNKKRKARKNWVKILLPWNKMKIQEKKKKVRNGNRST